MKRLLPSILISTLTLLGSASICFSQSRGRPNPCPFPPPPAGDTYCLGGPGCLDPSFSSDGFLLFKPAPGSVTDIGMHAVAVQSDGKIVGVGRVAGSYNGLFVARFLADGTLDTTFGDTDLGNPFQKLGYLIDNTPNGNARAVVVQPDGRIVVGGVESGAPIIRRYNSEGTRDTSFGDSGIVRPPLGSFVNDLLMQSDSKIIAVIADKFSMVRLNAADGSLDNTFGNNGVVSANFSTTPRGDGSSRSGAIQTIGGEERIVLGGYGYHATTKQEQNNAKPKFALMRFLPSGAIDSSFGVAGRVTTNFFNGQDIVFSVAMDSLNRIVAAGQTHNTACVEAADAGFARYNPDGSLDTSFSDDGKANIDIYNFGNYVQDMKLQTVGGEEKILGFGQTAWRTSASSVGHNDYAVVRLNANGTLDTTFGPGTYGPGKVTLNVLGNDYGYAGAVQPDNSILLAGHAGSNDGAGLFVAPLARYLP